MDYQKQYQNERINRQGVQSEQEKGNNQEAYQYDPQRYQSIHQNEFQKFRNQDEDDFLFLEKPNGDEERKAYEKADYQTRLKIERANSHKYKKLYDQSQVNEGHRNLKQIISNQNQKFDEDFISDKTLSKMDDFDLINVQRNYMDKNLIDQNHQEMDFQNNDKNDGLTDFFMENQKQLLGDEEFQDQFITRTQRSIGFNEYIEFVDPSIKGKSNAQNILSANRNKKINILSQNDINKTSNMFQKYENEIKFQQNDEEFEQDDLTLKLNQREDYLQRISHHIGQEKNIAEDEDQEEIQDQIMPLQKTKQYMEESKNKFN